MVETELEREKHKNKTLQGEKDELEETLKNLENKSSDLERDLKREIKLKESGEQEIAKLNAKLEEIIGK